MLIVGWPSFNGNDNLGKWILLLCWSLGRSQRPCIYTTLVGIKNIARKKWFFVGFRMAAAWCDFFFGSNIIKISSSFELIGRCQTFTELNLPMFLCPLCTGAVVHKRQRTIPMARQCLLGLWSHISCLKVLLRVFSSPRAKNYKSKWYYNLPFDMYDRIIWEIVKSHVIKCQTYPRTYTVQPSCMRKRPVWLSSMYIKV